MILASHSPAGILEVAKAAKLLSEIAAVDAEADLSGINAVDADAEFLQTAAAVVRSQTEVRGGGWGKRSKGLQGELLHAGWHSSWQPASGTRVLCPCCDWDLLRGYLPKGSMPEQPTAR